MNCTALNESLLDDELFGHEQGAFTGADRVRKGRFEAATGGTLFLDEIGDMPLTLQAKLLRVLENGEVFRIGSNTPIKVNVRLTSATNRDLEAAVEAGTFRKDLYYRLKIVTVKLPPLRDRREDIPLLTAHFLKEFTARHGKNVQRVSDTVRKAMTSYEWPGNVRELRNTIERAVLLNPPGQPIALEVLPKQLLKSLSAPAPVLANGTALKTRVDEFERELIRAALSQHGGVLRKAASELGMNPVTLGRKVKHHGL
jgi:two-component system response regulator HydG